MAAAVVVAATRVRPQLLRAAWTVRSLPAWLLSPPARLFCERVSDERWPEAAFRSRMAV